MKKAGKLAIVYKLPNMPLNVHEFDKLKHCHFNKYFILYTGTGVVN